MRSRLRDRISTVASTWSALALILAGLTIGVLNEKAYQTSRRQALMAQAEVLAATVEPALVFLDRSASNELVQALRANRQIADAAVYDSAGARVAEFHRQGGSPPERGDIAQHRRQAPTVTAPVLHENKAIGLVYLRDAAEPPTLLLRRHGGVALLLVSAIGLVLLAQGARRAQMRAAREVAARADELEKLNGDLQQQIERREAAEQALHQAQKMETLGQLTGGIAHDFNNLLQTVQGALDIIAKQPTDTERVGRWSRIGLEAAERGAKVTAQLLAFSRAQKLEMRPVLVGPLVDRLRELLPSAVGASIRVMFDVADAGEPVLADAVQLELAVLNLCINARDAMPNGGQITVSTRSETLGDDDPELPAGRYLLLSVADTGVGMPDDVRARAFDPFFTTKGVGKGTGLGLAQVYGIAKQSGGVARIESVSGQGTTVTILLPETQLEAKAASEGSTTSEPLPTTARVLVIDDDDGVRAFICDVLTLHGYDCIALADGRSGLDRLRAERFDLLIVDYAMPGITGAEVVTTALELQPGLPIIVASGYAESAALEQATGRPADLLRKPFDSRALLSRVAQSLTLAVEA